MSEAQLSRGPVPSEPDIDEVVKLIGDGSETELRMFLDLLPPGDVPYVINHLDEASRTRMFALLPPEEVAGLLEHLEDEQAADIIEELPAPVAADIIEELDSDDAADILGELDDEDQRAVLEAMEPREAADAAALIRYADHVAGGIMHRDYLAFREGRLIEDVVAELRAKQEAYAEYDVSCLYVVDAQQRLKGLVRLRDLILAPGRQSMAAIRVNEPATLHAMDTLDTVEDFFDEHGFAAAPVVDDEGRLVGEVRREAVEEALGEASQRTLGNFAGIIGGRELRSMPVTTRSFRRLAFLLPNICLALISASVIQFFEGTIARVTALAVFLPLIANTNGCSGNQAVAVSIRELALGVIRPRDVRWVVAREMTLGAMTGLVIGVVVFLVVLLWHRDVYLAGALAAAMPVGTMLAVMLGGAVPLILEGLGVDPAMASGPVITTVVDSLSFFTVLMTAHLMIDHLT